MAKTPEELREYNRVRQARWYAENRDKVAPKRAAQRKAHPEASRRAALKYAAAHREEIRASSKLKYPKIPVERIMLRTARERAARAEVPFTLSMEDITIPEKCPVLGISLVRGNRHVHDASPSLDRLQPERGYVPGNVCVMSHKANTIKSQGTAAEHEAIARWMRQQGLS